MINDLIYPAFKRSSFHLFSPLRFFVLICEDFFFSCCNIRRKTMSKAQLELVISVSYTVCLCIEVYKIKNAKIMHKLCLNTDIQKW